VCPELSVRAQLVTRNDACRKKETKMGDKGGKKDKNKDQKQKDAKKKQDEKKKQDKKPKKAS
jgi:hypothetical protein